MEVKDFRCAALKILGIDTRLSTFYIVKRNGLNIHNLKEKTYLTSKN